MDNTRFVNFSEETFVVRISSVNCPRYRSIRSIDNFSSHSVRPLNTLFKFNLLHCRYFNSHLEIVDCVRKYAHNLLILTSFICN